MKNTLTTAILFCLALAICSCTHKRTPPANTMIIYQAGGITGGSHPPYYYVVAHGQLTADTASNFVPAPVTTVKLNLNYVVPAPKNSIAQNLISSLPAELLVNNNAGFGVMPGNDMYSIVVTATINGIAYTWSFQADQSASSAQVQQFTSQLNQLF